MQEVPHQPVPAPAVPENTSRRLWRTPEQKATDKAAAAAQIAQDRIEEQRARDQREMERLEAEREHLKLQTELSAERKRLASEAATERKTERADWRNRISRAFVLASANIAVNVLAVVGQVLALHLGLGWEWWAAVPIALAAESLAINIGFYAHDKLVKGDPAWVLRITSYAIGGVVGWINYDHNASHPATDDLAVVFGGASVLSPVLWQIYSAWKHREQLREQGQLDPRAPKFPKLRWILPSLRAETYEAFEYGVAEGIQSPDVALAAIRARNATGNAEAAIRDAQQALIGVQADALKLTLTHLAAVYHDMNGEDPAGTEARADIARFISRFRPLIPPLDPGQLSVEPPTGGNESGTDSGTDLEPKGPSEQDNENAREFVKESIRRRKVVPSSTAVASEFDFSKSWGYDRVVEAKAELAAKGWTFPEGTAPISPAASKRVPAPVPARSSANDSPEIPATVNGEAR